MRLEDPIAKRLAERSLLSGAQLETYLISRMEGLNLAEKVRIRERPVSKGAFLRTLQQARAKLKRTICTLLLAEYLGLFEEGSLGLLLQVGEALLAAKERELSPEQIEAVLKTLDDVLERLV